MQIRKTAGTETGTPSTGPDRSVSYAVPNPLTWAYPGPGVGRLRGGKGIYRADSALTASMPARKWSETSFFAGADGAIYPAPVPGPKRALTQNRCDLGGIVALVYVFRKLQV